MRSIRPLHIHLPSGMILTPYRYDMKEPEPKKLDPTPLIDDKQKLPKLSVDWNKISVR